MVGERELSRREAAQEELGRTDFAPGVAATLVLLFLLTICAVPALQHVAELGASLAARKSGGGGGGSGGAAASAPSLLPQCYDLFRAFPSRPAIKAYEKRLEDGSVVGRWLLPHAEDALTGLCGAGNEQVYLGRGGGGRGGLFYRPEIDHLAGRGFLEPAVLRARALSGEGWETPVEPDPLCAILDFRRQLAARGIMLVVVPTPGKAAVEPEAYAASYAGFPRPLYNPSFPAFVAALEAAGVPVFDPAPEIRRARLETGRPQYLATDTHWRPETMEEVAARLAAFLRERLAPPANAPAGYTRQEKEIANRGDLLDALHLAAGRARYPLERVMIHPVAARSAPWAPDPEAEILLLGDSFSNIFSQEALGWGGGAGLAEQLSFFLQRPLDRIVLNDGGAWKCRRELDDVRLAGKRLVVWQFASRELSVGDWKILALPHARPGAAGGGTTGKPLRVRGTIRARGSIPTNVPYADCLLALHLTDVVALAGEAPGKELVVFVWGLRAHRRTPADAWRIGQEVTLPLTPWRAVERLYGSFNRAELDDDRLLALPLYWAEEPAAEPAPGTPAAAACLRGREGWLFFGPELAGLAAGRFWGASASRAERDPLPAILDFQAQLDAAGIELLLVPVPAKAAVYPEMLGATDPAASPPPSPPARVDLHQQEFYELLRQKGVHVLDLVPEFRRRRLEAEGPLYCRQDTHWSGRACALAAELIAREIGDRPWRSAIGRRTYATETRPVEITGDLWRMLGDPALPKEKLALTFVGTRVGERLEPVAPWRESPVLLLGDSHNLVFHAGGELHAVGAGLPDHLARVLGFPVDLVAVRGSGATSARLTLLRREDNLAGKKLVIWCLSAREFTAGQEWRKVPVLRGRKEEGKP